jgi:simple sugar transport system substrate-binding protein
MESAGVSVDKIEITATDPSKAAEQARGYLTNNPVDVIFTQGPPPAFPVIKVLDEEGLNEEVIHITGVLTPEIIEPIREGKVLAVVDQAPYLQGFQAVVQMDLYLRYNLLEGTDTTAEQVVDQSNIGPVEELIEKRIR